jgi:hypothetical protein
MNGEDDKGLMGESINDLDDQLDIDNPKKIIKKGKRYSGLLEWILDRDGHEFMCEVDRGYFRDKFNVIGLKE